MIRRPEFRIEKPERDLAPDVVAVITAIGERTYEPANIPHLGYEFYVERPRKAGIDPVYRSLMAEALAEAEAHHKAAS